MTNVIITSPGYNYTATPVFTLSGGGPTAAATITGAAPTANSQNGSMTFLGTGVTTLTGAQTYGGNMNVNQGEVVIPATAASTTPVAVNSGGTLVMNNIVTTNFSKSSIAVNNGGTFSLFTSVSNQLSNSVAVASGGSFVVSAQGANATASPVTVGDGGALSVFAGGFGGSWTVLGTLTLGATTGATVNLSANSQSTPCLIVGTLAVNGPNTVNISGNISAGGVYPLLTYTNSSGAGSLNFVMPNGVAGAVLTTNVAGSATTISLSAVSATVTSTIWTGSVNGTWDLTTANWIAPSGSLYSQGAQVLLDDAHNAGPYLLTNAVGIVVSPSAIVVSNTANNYVLSNSIVVAGASGITKLGSDSLTLYGQNTYTGPTIIGGGQVVAGAASVGGLSGPVGLNSGVILSNNAGAALNIGSNNTQIGSLSGGGAAGGNVITSGGVLTMGGDNTSQTFAGAINGAGGIAQIGYGAQTLAGTQFIQWEYLRHRQHRDANHRRFGRVGGHQLQQLYGNHFRQRHFGIQQRRQPDALRHHFRRRRIASERLWHTDGHRHQHLYKQCRH